uniref:Uncharacterized protein n=1 Tax=Oryza glumipatula TaxID=40148 RepID=A0A0D9ZUX6_9ORYZ
MEEKTDELAVHNWGRGCPPMTMTSLETQVAPGAPKENLLHLVAYFNGARTVSSRLAVAATPQLFVRATEQASSS